MKTTLTLILTLTLALPATLRAQKLVIGQRAPELRIDRHLAGPERNSKLPLLIDFFHSSSKPCVEQLPVLDAIARRGQGSLNVLLIAREGADRVEPLLADKHYSFSVALDPDGKSFSNFEVQYLPFSVLLDAKGRVLWFGNPLRLSPDAIDALLNP